MIEFLKTSKVMGILPKERNYKVEGWCTEVSERFATDWLKVNQTEIRTSVSLCWLGLTGAHEGCSLLEQHWSSHLPLFLFT